MARARDRIPDQHQAESVLKCFGGFMRSVQTSLFQAVLVAGLACAMAGVFAQPQTEEVLDVGEKVLDAETVRNGLFPEDLCKEVEETKLFTCMGIRPALRRFALPATTFKFGSAEIPDLLRKQLGAFAEVLRGNKDARRVVRVEGHTDAVGTTEANNALSQKRADAVRAYLVSQGVNGDMVEAVGVGAQHLKVANDPKAADNRRVEISRKDPPQLSEATKR
jgi:outer membrane protein OmpA-like peptidoglycan-associated protein